MKDLMCYFLFIDGQPINYVDYDKGMYSLEREAVNILGLPLYSACDGAKSKIESVRDFNSHCEYHNGCWAPICEIENSNGKLVDIKIIEGNKVDYHKDDLDIGSFISFCRENEINPL